MLFYLLLRMIFRMTEEAQGAQIQSDRVRNARLPQWRPRTRAEAKEADEDEDSLEEAERYEKSGQWKKALAIYRDLEKGSPVPEIVVKAKMGIKRVKRAQVS
jgi:hypothetical protein